MLKNSVIIAILFGLSLFGLISCKKESGNPTPPVGPSGPSSFVVTTHPNDPLFGIAKYDNGNQVHFFGQRDSIGTPLKITSFMTVVGNDSTWMHMNDAGKISMIRPQNGCEFTIDWQPDGSAVVAARPNDSTELQSEFTPAQRPGKGGFSPSSAGNEVSSGNRSGVTRPATINSDQNVCEVNLVKCGAAVLQSYDIRVIAQDGEGKNLGTFPAINMGGGVYKAMVPGGLAPTTVIALSKLCESLTDLLEVSCALLEMPTLKEYLCLSLSSAAAASGIAAPASGVIFTGCVAVGEALDLYCNTVNASGLSNKICSGEIWDRTIKYNMYLFATTPGYTRGISSPKVSVENGYQSLPKLVLPLPGKTKLEYLTISPSRPVNLDYFTLKCGLSCLPAGGKVKVIAKTARNTSMSDPYPTEIEYNVSETGEAFAEIPVFCARKAVQSFCLDVTILVSGGGQEAFGYHLHRDIR